ncbi:hypothetical protein OESDEN_00562 [Oesophagostomum dentatum]|uniref:Glutathione S-transferase protein n=1 Tax=Oesophagostomum dentatum TaxID=61180 RepID=A0A0B1TPG8_OESDE|nr:hypothetical protein OESDEN_00562 [Oesophagostomum dentatum]
MLVHLKSQMPGTRLLKRDWEKDHVYLVQFPRAGCIPSPSPFAFKVETWLRMADIPYTNISNEFTKFSNKGQIPFVEVNGRQVADSNFIIDHLIEEFHKKGIDERLLPIEKSYARAFHALIEDSLRWEVTTFHSIVYLVIASYAHAQGIGRYSPEEVVILAKKDLDAISMFLGNKKFFFGDKPVTLDCDMFAFLAQFLYTPLVTPEVKTHMEEHCKNLVRFVERMKEAYWPDWDEATKNRSMESNWKK